MNDQKKPRRPRVRKALASGKLASLRAGGHEERQIRMWKEMAIMWCKRALNAEARLGAVARDRIG